MENTIRWRTVFDKEGNAVKESNARMVKWSDGSMSLHLGSEIFDVYKQPLHVSYTSFFISFISNLTVNILRTSTTKLQCHNLLEITCKLS